MNLQKIRSDFPILKDVIYMDSASTSLTPEPVLETMLKYYREHNANVGRGVHRLSQMAQQRYNDAHRKVASFIGAQEGDLIFTRNATESINMVSQGLRWKRGERVVTTLAEHHSNFLPWLRLKKEGVDLEIIKPDKNGSFDASDFERAIDTRTRLVAVTHLTNVLGTVLPVKEISEICQNKGAMLLVDGAQSVPHMPISVKALGCDFLCFSGHKMLGPKGTGVLWTRQEIEPLLVGGGMVEDVSAEGFKIKKGYEGFEAGTPHISGGIGLGRAADYLVEAGMDEVEAHEGKLAGRLLDGLRDIGGVDVYGSSNTNDRSGIVSFTVRGLAPHDVALMLDHASNIMVRSGHHCCIPLMRHLGLKEGTVRVSLYLYNTKDEIDRLLGTAEDIAKMVG
ncbi:Cysteine desulfurase [uncultured archaeon]|nr:Cysteine desulfurase [uncultured archaeon]